MIFPGTYDAGESNPIEVPPNTELFAPSLESVTIVPTVSRTFSSITGDYLNNFTSIVFAGGLTWDMSSIAGAPAVVTFTNCAFHAASDPTTPAGTVTIACRASDAFLFTGTTFNVTDLVVNGGGGGTTVVCVGCSVVTAAALLNSTAEVFLRSGSTFTCPACDIVGGGVLVAEAMTIDANITVSGSLIATNCTLGAGSSIAVPTGGRAVLPGTQFAQSQLTSTGTGAADRSISTYTVTTSATSQGVPFIVPYITVPQVVITQTSGATTTSAVATSVTTAGFTLVTPAGNNYTITVLQNPALINV
jgi:hypothetical protein